MLRRIRILEEILLEVPEREDHEQDELKAEARGMYEVVLYYDLVVKEKVTQNTDTTVKMFPLFQRTI